MDWRLLLRLALLALPLTLDNFAVSALVGVTPMTRPARLRLAATFALAEGLMPAVGLLLGAPLGARLGDAGGYLGAVLIVALGLWLWWRSARAGDDDEEAERIAGAAALGGRALAALALSISLDELAVGFSFGVARVPLVPALLTIAALALLVSLLGQAIGRRAGARLAERLGERAERLIGPALCLLGIWLAIAQLAGWLG
jgi:putative Mn2+ efflux pump MntP